jgi:polyisoprenoid-binding protein YceI
MRKASQKAVLAIALTALIGVFSSARGDDYELDTMHAGVNFKISHLGLSWIYGRFNDFSGSFTLDADPTKCSFNLDIKSTSVDTNNKKRDDHLRSPDFFNVKQYPSITFKSTAVKAVKDGYEVKGDLTLHGETKAVTFQLLGGRKAEFPKGVQRTGYTTELTIKRSDFGIGKKFGAALGEDVHISISFEGVKK